MRFRIPGKPGLLPASREFFPLCGSSPSSQKVEVESKHPKSTIYPENL
ncbi:MAG: hypothetical protein K9H26_02465 [Prolixibacteraceae bacterium]|nr:hypothetical protein [Prolixibacteraceae bacterium]